MPIWVRSTQGRESRFFPHHLFYMFAVTAQFFTDLFGSHSQLFEPKFRNRTREDPNPPKYSQKVSHRGKIFGQKYVFCSKYRKASYVNNKCKGCEPKTGDYSILSR